MNFKKFFIKSLPFIINIIVLTLIFNITTTLGTSFVASLLFNATGSIGSYLIKIKKKYSHIILILISILGFITSFTIVYGDMTLLRVIIIIILVLGIYIKNKDKF
ncbi:MAG: hypothetical protein FH753_02610 [Firmicutes bacterium]|nr:hypothetical protein [Bacillota bacterium]